MISAVHAIIYSSDAEADRAFLRDVLPGGRLGLYEPRHPSPLSSPTTPDHA